MSDFMPMQQMLMSMTNTEKYCYRHKGFMKDCPDGKLTLEVSTMNKSTKYMWLILRKCLFYYKIYPYLHVCKVFLLSSVCRSFEANDFTFLYELEFFWYWSADVKGEKI